MHVSVTEAKKHLAALMRRAEAGDEVVLTHNGRATVKLVPVPQQPKAEMRRAAIADAQAAVRKRLAELGEADDRPAGPSAARSQDFLYDDDGLPG